MVRVIIESIIQLNVIYTNPFFSLNFVQFAHSGCAQGLAAQKYVITTREDLNGKF